MVHLLASVAAASPRVTAEVVDAAAFADLTARYKVGAVPKTVIDETVEIQDRIPAADLISRLAGKI